jgi:hypothetical protein
VGLQYPVGWLRAMPPRTGPMVGLGFGTLVVLIALLGLGSSR